ncbi:MAG: glycosyltransferase [Pirellulales bacterium]|nr:glycosyltransferase [Pirellulales bacterium]
MTPLRTRAASVDVLLMPLGTAGDVHPFLGLGLELAARGHRVRVATNESFAPLVQRTGLEFIQLSTAEQFRQALAQPDVWHPRRGVQLMGRFLEEVLPETLAVLQQHAQPGKTVVAAPALLFGARLAQELWGLTLATVHLQPIGLPSRHTAYVPHPLFMATASWPGWWQRLAQRAGSLLMDRWLAAGLNRQRRLLGLPPVRRLLEWWNSPQCVIGLFPSWFAPPQPDWPPQAVLADFPRFDESGVQQLDAEAVDFLAAGPPPIVFTPGSGMQHAHRFFEVSAEVCRRLRERGVLLSRHAGQIPAHLPPGVKWFSYLPFSWILPRARAVVHHGGVGSLAQALAAGIPQIIVPLAYDQPDNAVRAVRLGVARVVRPGAYRVRRVARLLQELIGSDQVARRAGEAAERVKSGPGLAAACQALEELAVGRTAASGAPCGEAVP